MRKHKVIVLILLVIILSIPAFLHASNIGGKIITTRTDLTCAGYTAVNIRGLSGTYAVPNSKTVGPNKNILGKSTSFMTPICTQGETPYPVYVVRPPFGVSH